jgi:cysteinyl-tRNA synthetase
VLHESVREGNGALASGDLDVAVVHAAHARAMLDVLGVDPYAESWQGDSRDDDRLRTAVDHLVAGLLEARTRARADKDWATADTIRDQLKAAGIVVDDTAGGSRWSLDSGKEH